MISIVGLGLVKSSILVMYKNIFDVRKFRIAVYIVLAYVVGWTVSFTISHLFTCYPITVFIEPYYGNSCVDTVPMFLALLVGTLIYDVIVPSQRHLLTDCIVYRYSCRFCHIDSPDTDGLEFAAQHEEEAGCHCCTYVGRSVSANKTTK
jgi:hypothetical protein